jgi:hypothetical protein
VLDTLNTAPLITAAPTLTTTNSVEQRQLCVIT